MRDIDLSAIRARLADKTGPQFWRSLEEVAETPEFEAMLHREFPQGASEFTDPAGRRDFLRLMGASIALAGAAACTRQPEEKIIPYVKAPEEIVPGKPLFFATAMPLGGAAWPVLVESHMGRPTKIEPNPEHPLSKGGTDVFAQASVLNLYDPDRSQTIIRRGEIRPWSEFVTELNGALMAQTGLGGAGLRLLTETVSSPTLADQITRLLAKYPQAKWIQYDAVSRDYAREGARLAFGEYVEPQYRVAQADVILIARRRFPRRWAGQAARCARVRRAPPGRRGRCGDEPALRRSRAGSTNTGSKADHRLALKARDIEPFARALAAALGVAGAGAATPPEGAHCARSSTRSSRICRPTAAARSSSPATRSRRPCTCWRTRSTPRSATPARPWSTPRRPKRRRANQTQSLRDLCADMAAGKVDALVMVGVNPVYTAPNDLNFAEVPGEGGAAGARRPLPRRDGARQPLAHPRDALSRDVERRARGRRHGHRSASR